MRVKLIITLLLLSASATWAQTKEQTNGSKSEIRALAKFISDEGGSKVHFSKFKIVKNFSDLTLPEVVDVGYYFYKENTEAVDTVLLILDTTKTLNGYFACPEFDAAKGIQPAKVEHIGYDYWEGCETGKRACKPLRFTRSKNQKNWFLLMPCGGTSTSITVISTVIPIYAKEITVSNSQCPPCLELTDMADGKYVASMRACELGGRVEFDLITK